jgi:signal transduction histidine kinase
VVGFAHELRDGLNHLDDDEIEVFVGLIGDQAVEVSDLVEDLLVASRLELEEVTVTREAIDLWEQVDSVMGARRVGSQVRTERDGEAKVFADPIRVRQVFRNLLTNADRYGGDHITVRVVTGPEVVSLFVIDDGEGVPERDRIKIFEPYYRAHHDEGRTESVGLGLTVSRQLARLMDGDLTYAYHQGHSFFELRLPAA